MAMKIEVEGTDGAGKTTAYKYLIEKLKEAQGRVLETREVGSPLIPINVKLRELVLSPESGLSGEAMELIFSAMRVENDRYYKAVGKDFDFIVSDRGWLSHLAYTDHNCDKQLTKDLYLNFLKARTSMPDVVIYLDVNTDTALQRRVKRGEGMDVIEMKGVEYQEKVRGSFKEYLSNRSTWAGVTSDVFYVDANASVEEVQAQLDQIVDKLVARAS